MGRSRVTTVPLCMAPCVADFGYGHHILRYSSMGDEGNVSFAPLTVKKGSVSIVRHALGHYRSYPGLQSAGSFGMVVGFPLLFLGAGTFIAGQSNIGGDVPGASDVRSSLSTAGGVTLGIGAALATLGVVLKIVGRDEYQPGSTLQWDEPDADDVPTPLKEPAPAATPANVPAATPAAH